MKSFIKQQPTSVHVHVRTDAHTAGDLPGELSLLPHCRLFFPNSLQRAARCAGKHTNAQWWEGANRAHVKTLKCHFSKAFHSFQPCLRSQNSQYLPEENDVKQKNSRGGRNVLMQHVAQTNELAANKRINPDQRGSKEKEKKRIKRIDGMC